MLRVCTLLAGLLLICFLLLIGTKTTFNYAYSFQRLEFKQNIFKKIFAVHSDAKLLISLCGGDRSIVTTPVWGKRGGGGLLKSLHTGPLQPCYATARYV